MDIITCQEVCTNERDRYIPIGSFHIRNRTTDVCRKASLRAGGIKSFTAVVAGEVHWTVIEEKTHFEDELIVHMVHLCCPKNVTSSPVPLLPPLYPPSPLLHPTSLPHVLSAGRWIALLYDINNMTYCWSVRGKACELSIPSHWLHDWDAVFFFSLFLSFYPSNSLWPSIFLSFLSYSLLCLF